MAARRSSEELPADARPRFEVADVRSARHEADAVICVGASHAFGAPADLFTTLAAVSPPGTALVGDGVWQATPDPWCVETFGRLPSGPDDLAARAAEAGWSIDDVDTSTLAEWAQFEQGGIEGARSTGLPEANRFADERWRQYQRYRGVLGFCWLVLTR